MLLNIKTYLLILVLASSSAYAEKCNDRADVVQDPGWYRLRINEVKKAKARLEDILKATQNGQVTVLEKAGVSNALYDAKKLLSSATWQYPQIEPLFKELLHGLDGCKVPQGDNVDVNCYVSNYLKNPKDENKNIGFTDRLLADMQEKLGSLSACDPTAKLQSKLDEIALKTKRMKRNEKNITALKTLVGMCQRPGVLPETTTSHIQTILEEKPVNDLPVSERKPATVAPNYNWSFEK